MSLHKVPITASPNQSNSAAKYVATEDSTVLDGPIEASPAVVGSKPVQSQPVDADGDQSAMAAYRSACESYARAVRSAQRDRDRAERRYRSEVSAVRKSAQEAVFVRDSAIRQASEAAQHVTDIDTACADIWRRIRSYVGVQRHLLTPAPDEDSHIESAAQLRSHLTQLRHTVATVQRGELPFATPRYAVPVAVAIGAGTAGLAIAGMAVLYGVMATSDTSRAMLQAGGLVLVVLGVFAGIPIVSGWLSIRHRLKCRPVYIAACLVGALATLSLLLPWLLSA